MYIRAHWTSGSDFLLGFELMYYEMEPIDAPEQIESGTCLKIGFILFDLYLYFPKPTEL